MAGHKPTVRRNKSNIYGKIVIYRYQYSELFQALFHILIWSSDEFLFLDALRNFTDSSTNRIVIDGNND